MERAVALKKLRKIIGNSLGYRVDDKAPSAEAREAARLRIPGLVATRKAAEAALSARLAALLAADDEYQRLAKERDVAREHSAAAFATANRYKITVGSSGALFFTVKAQGDSWEDVIAKLNGGAR
jgi:hypothetical protein